MVPYPLGVNVQWCLYPQIHRSHGIRWQFKRKSTGIRWKSQQTCHSNTPWLFTGLSQAGGAAQRQAAQSGEQSRAVWMTCLLTFHIFPVFFANIASESHVIYEFADIVSSHQRVRLRRFDSLVKRSPKLRSEPFSFLFLVCFLFKFWVVWTAKRMRASSLSIRWNW